MTRASMFAPAVTWLIVLCAFDAQAQSPTRPKSPVPSGAFDAVERALAHILPHQRQRVRDAEHVVAVAAIDGAANETADAVEIVIAVAQGDRAVDAAGVNDGICQRCSRDGRCGQRAGDRAGISQVDRTGGEAGVDRDAADRPDGAGILDGGQVGADDPHGDAAFGRRRLDHAGIDQRLAVAASVQVNGNRRGSGCLTPPTQTRNGVR